jgi:hypothetical protein
VFEVIAEANVVCEGWRDKKLMEVFRESKKKDASYQSLLKVGLCHANGVKDIKNLVPIFQVCNRKVLILTDADAAANEKKQEHLTNRCYGDWITYRDAFPDGPAIETAEDFIAKKTLVEAAKQANAATGSTVSVSEPDIPDVSRIAHVKGLARAALVDGTRVNVWMNEWKSAIFANLKAAHIEPRFSELVDYLLTKLPA